MGDLDGKGNSTGLASYGKECPWGSGGEKCLLATCPKVVAELHFVIRYPQALAWAWARVLAVSDGQGARGPGSRTDGSCFGSNRPTLQRGPVFSNGACEFFELAPSGQLTAIACPPCLLQPYPLYERWSAAPNCLQLVRSNSW